MTNALQAAHTTFELPAELSAAEPPEHRGLDRAGVRLLVARPEGITHARFADLTAFLAPGDLVVVNTSATLPAAVDGRRADGSVVPVHFSAELEDGAWIVELRNPDGMGPLADASRGEVIELPDGVLLTLLAAHPDAGRRTGSRLWRTRVAARLPVRSYLHRNGRPISYAYLRRQWPLTDYQTVFALESGSAEMPSAGRPFTDALVTDLVSHGVLIAPVLLHTGVSSLEAGEAPQAERYEVPAQTARLVRLTQAAGGRVIAVGTTVTRALESAVSPDGVIQADAGWTDLVLGPQRPAQVVDGLITGWHAPQASHLLLLEAVAGPALVQEAYDAALEQRYLWHEFGDSALLLPKRNARELQRTA
ncbi:MAG: S-adenosylmethionine:tRNA ribosyltransferase-isomerase [Actinomycetota bacterium]